MTAKQLTPELNLVISDNNYPFIASYDKHIFTDISLYSERRNEMVVAST